MLHTPGPWDCHTFLPEAYKIVPKGLSALEFSTSSSVEFFANAHLIAAAPELLEACKEAEAWLCFSCHKTGCAVCRFGELRGTLRKVIAEAEGK